MSPKHFFIKTREARSGPAISPRHKTYFDRKLIFFQSFQHGPSLQSALNSFSSHMNSLITSQMEKKAWSTHKKKIKKGRKRCLWSSNCLLETSSLLITELRSRHSVSPLQFSQSQNKHWPIFRLQWVQWAQCWSFYQQGWHRKAQPGVFSVCFSTSLCHF